MGRRTRDAEAELNLPPGFRFHPTDEELVVHYLCRKVAYQCLPVPIIAEVDLYKYDPWELPEKAMFGQKEWYFFTPRDRKYPNGSRPNRAAGRGYWKATGADKPVSANGTGRPIGIKKALVFYSGKAPKGIKTDWIMHEYRLADTTRSSANKKGTLRLDEWVLCRLYNKKNNWEKLQQQKEPTNSTESVSDSFRTMPESDVEDDMINDSGNMGLKPLQLSQDFKTEQQENNAELKPLQLSQDFKVEQQENNEWFMDLSLDDLQNSFFGSAVWPPVWPPALEPAPNQDYYYFQTNLSSPQLRRTDPPHF